LKAYTSANGTVISLRNRAEVTVPFVGIIPLPVSGTLAVGSTFQVEGQTSTYTVTSSAEPNH
jgi:hypothetical protein